MIISSPFYFLKLLQEEMICVLIINKKNYCICNRPCFEPMIACDRPNCKVEWYHYAFVKVIRGPKGSYSLASLEECKLMRAFAQINLSQFAGRSCGEQSCLQQGSDSQINSFDFLVLISLILFVKFDNGI